jgi:hypothetical protein
MTEHRPNLNSRSPESWLYTVTLWGDANETIDVLSFLAIRGDQVGSPPEAVVGSWAKSDERTAERFRLNPAFVEFMHDVIETVAPDDAGFKGAAREQGEGWVAIIDLRTPEGPQGNVPPEDIIGAFKIKRGKILRDSYWRNDRHRLYTRNGVVQLPPTLRDALVEALRSL